MSQVMEPNMAKEFGDLDPCQTWEGKPLGLLWRSDPLANFYK